MVVGGDDGSTFPPWLSFNAPKRKKQAMSLDDFDFNQLIPSITETVKKAKILSRVMVDKNKNKYVEVDVPPQDAIIVQV